MPPAREEPNHDPRRMRGSLLCTASRPLPRRPIRLVVSIDIIRAFSSSRAEPNGCLKGVFLTFLSLFSVPFSSSLQRGDLPPLRGLVIPGNTGPRWKRARPCGIARTLAIFASTSLPLRPVVCPGVEMEMERDGEMEYFSSMRYLVGTTKLSDNSLGGSGNFAMAGFYGN